ncbi:hypothetical protein DMJ13_09970 [halophilic archaeon]|nr:hypothetical protein DMJ13_09970 [halophilic archaeon]
MRGSSVAIQVLAALMLVAGIAVTGYALSRPAGDDTVHTLEVTKLEGNPPGSESKAVKYGDLSTEARSAFAEAKLIGTHTTQGDLPSQLEANTYVRDGKTVYELAVSERERITDRLVFLFGGTTTGLIGAFVFVSWLDVGQRR